MATSPVKRCTPTSARCQGYWPGHNVHSIQARLVGQSPWDWRDATVTKVRGLWISVVYLESGALVRLWHHHSLAKETAVDQPVRVHEGDHVLGGPFGIVSVVIQGGLGPVPTPDNPELWAAETRPGIVDMSTGRAVSVDFPSPRGQGPTEP